jgi:hypothetical protein
MKATLGKNAFARRMRDWEIVQNQRQECSPGRTMAGIEGFHIRNSIWGRFGWGQWGSTASCHQKYRRK